MTRRNGKIELLRFVFCILVLMYHVGKDFWADGLYFGSYLSFFRQGRNGVEFFFLLSGFFMAKSAFKYRNEDLQIGKQSLLYVYNKAKSVFLPHLLVIAGVIVAFIIPTYDSPLWGIIKRLPSIFFLQQTGLVDPNATFIGVEWYISSMLIAIALIYPILLWNYDIGARAVAPIGSVFLIGWLIRKYGCLPSDVFFEGWYNNRNIRAIAIILLGVFAYELSRYIVNHGIIQRHKVLMILIENVCFIFAICFTFSSLSEYELFEVAALFLGIIICLSREVPDAYNNKFVYYLGRISLPVYLAQNLVRNVVETFMTGLSTPVKIALIIVFTIIVGIIVDMLTNVIRKQLNKKEKII